MGIAGGAARPSRKGRAPPGKDGSARLVKSRKRVADHGEVFTPEWMVNDMLDLVKDESERIDSRFLDPACGNGNFLAEVLRRKLATVECKHGKAEFERRQYALLALMCIYGIEILEDNNAECRGNMLELFSGHLGIGEHDELYRAADNVLLLNIVHGDALTKRTAKNSPIVFSEWGYLGIGKFQRREFRFDVLAKSSDFRASDSPSPRLGKHEVFTPVKTYTPMTVSGLASASINEEDEGVQ